MKILQRFFQSSLGKKYIMALTGLGLFVFVIGHLLGNLQIFLGREAINAYGHFLQSNPEIIWPARLLLLLGVGLHIWSAITLTRENRAARPVQYSEAYQPAAASYASRTMMMSGLIIAAFIIYHLLHFTFKVPQINLINDPATRDFKNLIDYYPGIVAVPKGQDVYGMMVAGFRVPLVSGFYILAMGLLCLHLSHGVSSLFQSLGLKTKAWGPLIDRAGVWIAWVIFLGYSSIPITVLLGYGKEIVK